MSDSFIEIDLPVKTKILDKASEFVQGMLKNELPAECQFHDLKNTQEIVKITGELADEYHLKEKEKENLILSAWFHATGFTRDYKKAVSESVDIATDFLKGRDFDKDRLQEVQNLIESTRRGHKPENLKEEILHDATIAYIGRKRYNRKSELLRIEEEHFLDKDYTQHKWEKKQFDFLIQHDFYTSAGRKEYSKRRNKNIRKQRKNIRKARKVSTRAKTGKDLGRGIDTLFRANYRNHINLSAIADGKANMMISINTIILSVIVTASGAGLSFSSQYIIEHLRFTIPVFILLIGALVSVIFAILSARPDVTSKEVDMTRVRNNETSLLYFGNFLGVNKEKFIKYLNELKQDQKQLYEAMAVDMYQLGIVLRKKYRLLTYAYNSFMVALILCVIAFTGIFFYTNA